MIQNKSELTDHGERDARVSLLDIGEHSLAHIHPQQLIDDHLTVDGSVLTVDGERYDLSTAGDVFIVGAGKGSSALAGALRERLGDRVTDGVVVEKHGQGDSVPGIDVYEAGHPIPDDDGRRATQALLELVEAAGADDLVFVCITGGASAQLVAPPSDVSVADLASMTELLLHGGLPIEEINTVRKHVSTIKGGRLTERIAPATCVSLIIVDEVAGDPWGPTVPDMTTYDDAIGVLARRNLWERVPASIRSHLEARHRGEVAETPPPESLTGVPGQTVVLANATDLCEAAVAGAKKRGFNSMLLSSVIEGESRTVGTVLASIAKEIRHHDRPIEPPCVVVSGGETTVTISDEAGTGGPNQELALQFAVDAAELPGVALLALGTDGTDGPTDIAGGLVDGTTARRARENDIDLFSHLTGHDTSPALAELGDAVLTGATGTNVMDLRLLLVTRESQKG
ncbi:glycerate kinase [Haladaptatus sp. YSMS36]|uniref:glycerate kinase type-2 family protein n=2 Tax=unclassified Haladaptatus TaxID=2622732 RepID=UPI0023E829F8|nr:glycerate kinase [Haladaptatus sp. YSMS36]